MFRVFISPYFNKFFIIIFSCLFIIPLYWSLCYENFRPKFMYSNFIATLVQKGCLVEMFSLYTFARLVKTK